MKRKNFYRRNIATAVNMKGTLKESRAENCGDRNTNNDNFDVEVIIKELKS